MRSRGLSSDECARASEWISLRLDSQLSDFEGILLEAHLQRCPCCRETAAATAELTTMLRSAPLEEPTFALQLPQRHSVRAYGFRAISTIAAVATIGLSGLVGMQLSTTRLPGVAVNTEREVIGLKERQMEELDGTARKTQPEIRLGVQAAERVTLGSRPEVRRQRSTSAPRRGPLNG